jgi:lysozyme
MMSEDAAEISCLPGILRTGLYLKSMNLDNAARFIAQFEGFVPFPYDDARYPPRRVSKGECYAEGGRFRVRATGGYVTIGYGVTAGMVIEQFWDKDMTEPEAFARLKIMIRQYNEGVNGCVDVPLTEGQEIACTSLAYNIGIEGFCNSTVARRLNQRNYAGAAEAFHMWIKGPGGKVYQGLVDRRKKEVEKFWSRDDSGTGAMDWWGEWLVIGQ